MKKSKGIVCLCFLLCMLLLPCVHIKAVTKWQQIKADYENDEEVDHLIFVKYKKKAKADIYFYEKTENGWNKVFQCAGIVGMNGIDKEREGDMKTPTGTYNITLAMGIKENPGTQMDYIQIDKRMYWSARKKDYNQLVIRKKATWIRGEHLIGYAPYYNYLLAMDFNKEGEYKKGSAIFLHCMGKPKYTHGCIAIKEKYMKRLMKRVTTKTKICIY